MKNKNKFSSYAEALKRLELIKSQELQEATKYVLKTNTPKSEEPAPAPAMDEPAPAPNASPEASAPAPSDSEEGEGAPIDMGSEEERPAEDSDSKEEMGTEDAGGEEGPEHMKEVQRLSGKLGQAIREVNDQMESDDVKYVINMLLSAVDLEKLSEEDKEAIVDRFEPKEEEGGGEEKMGGEEEPSYDENPELDDNAEDMSSPDREEEVSEIEDPIASLEELINTDLMDPSEEDKSDEKDELDITPEQIGRAHV